MMVSARWHRWCPVSEAFVPDSEALQLPARETPRCLLVALPLGYVERIRLYDRMGRRRKTARVWVRGRGFATFFFEVEIPL